MPMLAPVVPIISLLATVAGTAVSVSGAQYQAQAQQNMYNYQATVARQNAAYESQLGENKAQIQGMKTRAMLGGIVSQQGAGNIDVASGTNKDVSDSALKLGQFDESTIRSDAARRAYNYEVQATMDTASAESAKVSGEYNVASSILGGIGSVSSKWLQGSQMGMWGA